MLIQSDRDTEIADTAIREQQELAAGRSTFDSHWEEIAGLVVPSFKGTFTQDAMRTPGEKNTQEQIDSTSQLALSRFGAILDSLLTPRNSTWHGLMSSNPYVQKDRQARLWFEEATRLLFQYRYAPTANFSSQNQQNYISLGAFGNGPMFIDRLDALDGARGLRYRALTLGQVFLRENHQGVVDGFHRRFPLTARQAALQFGEDRLPDGITSKLKTTPETVFWFLHCVKPRSDYMPGRLDYRGKLYGSYHVSLEGRMLVREGGYNTFPLAASRYEQAPGEVYGRGPAMMVLPAMKTLNAEKRTVLKAGHRIAEPIILTADDGLVSFNMRPGAVNPGSVNADGRPLVHPLPIGDVRIGKELMDDERAVINDAFLVTLFQILTETPTMTATEVIERTNEKGILLAPTIGRQQSEYLGPMIDRELDILGDMGVLPPMPGILVEAQGEYNVVYTSPLSRAQHAQEAAGFMRTLEVATNVASVTADPAIFDSFDFETAIPEISQINAVPTKWMASEEKIAERQARRAEQAQAQQEIQAAPAAAAMMKARAAERKAGGK